MTVLDFLFRHSDQAALYGLSLVFVVAGFSKFVFPLLWTGFEPPWLESLLPITARQLVYYTGTLEAAGGLLLATRWNSHVVAFLMSLWLLGITVSVASLHLWPIALRDLGLAVFAFYVAANEYSGSGSGIQWAGTD